MFMFTCMYVFVFLHIHTLIFTCVCVSLILYISFYWFLFFANIFICKHVIQLHVSRLIIHILQSLCKSMHILFSISIHVNKAICLYICMYIGNSGRHLATYRVCFVNSNKFLPSTGNDLSIILSPIMYNANDNKSV